MARSTAAGLTPGELPIRFIERLLAHTKGDYAGRPFILGAWQRSIVRDLFGTLGPDGRRRYRKALLGLPRKNGKTTLAAALALYLLVADGEIGGEVYSAAGDKDQARLVFGEARRMAEQSLIALELQFYRDAIEHKASGSVYRVISAEASTKHGFNPSGVVYDELHVAADRDLWDVLTSAQGTRAAPLVLAITTAGYDRRSICYELYQYGRDVERAAARGELADPSFFFRWFGADDADPWDDPATWYKANPGLGDGFLRREFLEDEARQAAAMPARQNAFRQLYLNQWTEQAARWIDMGLWDENGAACGAGLEAWA